MYDIDTCIAVDSARDTLAVLADTYLVRALAVNALTLVALDRALEGIRDLRPTAAGEGGEGLQIDQVHTGPPLCGVCSLTAKTS